MSGPKSRLYVTGRPLASRGREGFRYPLMYLRNDGESVYVTGLTGSPKDKLDPEMIGVAFVVTENTRGYRSTEIDDPGEPLETE